MKTPGVALSLSSRPVTTGSLAKVTVWSPAKVTIAWVLAAPPAGAAATFAASVVGLVEVDDHRLDELVHERRDRDAALDVAILVEGLHQPGEVGDDRVVELVDLAVHAIHQLGQVDPWVPATTEPRTSPPTRNGDGLALAVVELAAVVGDAGERRRLVPQAADRACEDPGGDIGSRLGLFGGVHQCGGHQTLTSCVVGMAGVSGSRGRYSAAGQDDALGVW